MVDRSKRSASSPHVLRPRDVAERWDCSERFVRNMIERGELPQFRLGGKLIRVAMADLEEYERVQKRKTLPT